MMTNCAFSGNSAYGGGGIYNRNNSSTMITNCAFSENSARTGGGMFNFQSSSKVANCVFNKNSADYGNGGGMYNFYSNPIVANCTFIANVASSGAGIYISNSSLMLKNCTVTGNLAEYNGGGIYSFRNNLTVNNCILWGNDAENGPQINLRDNSIAYIQYTNLQGGPGNVHINPDAELNWGRGNIDADPCFVQPGYSIPPPPLFKASVPNPPDGAIGVSLTPYLTWTPGHDAISHDVYFGIANPPPFIGNQTAATFVPGTIDYGTTYYWRIDEVSDSTVTIGDIWNFTTYLFPPPPPPLPLLNASMSDNGQYILTEHDYHLLPDSPCINAGDPNYIAAPNETDLDGYMRVVDGRIDMGAYEYIQPIQAEVSIIPNTINPESKGSWITCYIRLPQGSKVSDIDPNTVFLEDQIQPEQFSIDEYKQVATAKFRREDIQAILDVGEIELTITGRLNDPNYFEGTDVIKVINKASGKTDKYEQASNPDPPDGATEVSRTADLSWTPSSSAMSRDVYFGTATPPPFIGNQTATTFDPGKMDYETIYFWRIDEINKWGTTTGDIWHFTTIEAPPPPSKPPGTPPGCFPADTPVWIDGAQVQISKVTAGRKVGMLDATDAVSCFEKSVCLKEIESVLEYQGTYDYYNIVLENGNRINVVHSHYFLTASDQWVLVENLKVGSKLKSLKGSISIKTIAKRETPFTGRFYNLKIKGGDRYFVGKDGVVVRSH
jgi:hypothetical protein